MSAPSKVWPYIIGTLLLVAGDAGCDGPQSALAPAGRGAQDIATLFWRMVAAGSVIWLVMVVLGIYSVRTHADALGDRRRVRWLIIGGGSVIPTILLSVLLLTSLPMLPELLAPAPPGALRIEVRGKMWWWRVRYLTPDGESVELANEIRLPVGEPVEFQLASDDVIHAFWIPSLGGKVDMIPGRLTRLKLEPTKTGIYRGACAEYCGMSHALMNFDVVVMEKVEFAQWLDQQREPARTPSEPLAIRGQQLFIHNGCPACHTVRGTEATRVIGPDLTHVGSRHTLGAGILKNEPRQFVNWIAHPDDLKPGVKMPAFDMLPEEHLQAIAAYLETLQ
ncbi:MAG TPA: cytochrome c oxidase subunit II [Pirellulaceae bacterium]|nr:cytochrome c oxidase subunit II [Pirellulaceae bacterium]